MRKKKFNWHRRLRNLLLLKLILLTRGLLKETRQERIGIPGTNRDRDELCRSMGDRIPNRELQFSRRSQGITRPILRMRASSGMSGSSNSRLTPTFDAL